MIDKALPCGSRYVSAPSPTGTLLFEPLHRRSLQNQLAGTTLLVRAMTRGLIRGKHCGARSRRRISYEVSSRTQRSLWSLPSSRHDAGTPTVTLSIAPINRIAGEASLEKTIACAIQVPELFCRLSATMQRRVTSLRPDWALPSRKPGRQWPRRPERKAIGRSAATGSSGFGYPFCV